MDTLQYTEKWLSSDLQQSKIMLGYGVTLLVCGVLFLISKDVFFKGAAIPMFLLSILFGVYGANVMRKYPEAKKSYEASYQADKQGYIKTEQSRLKKLSRTYFANKLIWVMVIVVGLIICIIINTSFVKGVGLGLLLFGVSAFTADFLFDYSVKKYLLMLSE